MPRSIRRRIGYVAAAGSLALLSVVLAPVPALAATGATTRVSVASDGTEGDLESRNPATSGDGRFVVFESSAGNLVPGDTNGVFDVFIHDYLTGVTERISLANDGAQLAAAATVPDVSGDGRFVTFQTSASNVVAGDTNNANDIFVRDRVGGTTERVSVASGGGQATGSSTVATISADGRHVAFESTATNLVAGDTNGVGDIFLRDRQAGVTTRVSVSSSLPVQESHRASVFAAISADGRYVAFQSASANLVAGDANNANDIFVHDRQTGTTTRVSVANDGTQGIPHGIQQGAARRPTLSADGRYVGFESSFTNLVSGDTNAVDDVFVHDRQTSTTTRVSLDSAGDQANANSLDPAISADGRYVAFNSPATNLTSGDTNGVDDIFVRDRQSSTTSRVSVGDDDRQGNGASTAADLSGDGRYFAFASHATNLILSDGNLVRDVYVRDTQGVAVPRPKVLLGVGDVAVHEGDAGARAAIFTVSLSKPAVTTVSVDYATADASAAEGSDYTAKAGSLSFAPGVTSLAVKVPVTADGSDESNETFTVSLSGAVGATIADASGTGTIFDDDPATQPGLRLAIGDVRVHEGNKGKRTAVFNVSLSSPAASTVTVKFEPFNQTATLPGDYEPKFGTLSFPPGTTSLPIKVTINPDIILEGNETFTMVLSAPTGPQVDLADAIGVGTILDDD